MIDFTEVTLEKSARTKLIDEIAAYAETDLLCYFAEDEALYARQCESWEPILRAIEAHYGETLVRTQGIMPVAQPAFWRTQAAGELQAYDDAALVAFATLVTNLGSVLLALAVTHALIDMPQALAAAQLDEEYQQSEWGEDTDIAKILREKADKARAAQAFLGKAA